MKLPKSFAPGLLRHRVEIQSATTTDDGYGGTATTWSTTSTVWARIEPLSGRDLFFASQRSPQTTHKITMRGSVSVTTGDRIVFKNRTFHVQSVLRHEEMPHGYLTIMAVEESPE